MAILRAASVLSALLTGVWHLLSSHDTVSDARKLFLEAAFDALHGTEAVVRHLLQKPVQAP